MKKIIVEVNDLTKQFGKKKSQITAIDNISFKVKEGEIVGLLGPNGAGKTTVINILLGLIKPENGNIKIFDKNLAKKREEILQKVGFASTYLAMQSKLSLYENLLIYSYLYNIKEKKTKIKNVLQEVDLANESDKQFGSLSSGQKTRAILAKALLPRPRLLILDEPTASLDPDIAEKVQDLLLKITKKYQVTVFYTSHNMHEVVRLCDEIIFLLNGKIAVQGDPAGIIQKMEKKDLHQVFISLAQNK